MKSAVEEEAQIKGRKEGRKQERNEEVQTKCERSKHRYRITGKNEGY
jgi:hypothetical protein